MTKRIVQLPAFLCNSCTKCSKKRCKVFNRPVKPDLNRCFYHSNYYPANIAFEDIGKSKEIREIA